MRKLYNVSRKIRHK